MKYNKELRRVLHEQPHLLNDFLNFVLKVTPPDFKVLDYEDALHKAAQFSVHEQWVKKFKTLQGQVELLVGQGMQFPSLKTLQPKHILELGTPGYYSHGFASKFPQMSPFVVYENPASWLSWISLLVSRTFCKSTPWPASNNLQECVPHDAQFDLVLAMQGFHHLPLVQREPFLIFLAGIVRPGGFLLVREHDVTSRKSARVVSACHSLFNAIMCTTVK